MLWCTNRSIAAAVVIGSLNIFSHAENGRLLVIIVEAVSYRSANKVNSTSISSLFCWTYPMSSMMSASYLRSFLKSAGSAKSLFAIKSSWTRISQFLKRTRWPWRINSFAMAQSVWLFPEPGLPKTRIFSCLPAIIQRLLSIQFGGSRSIEREPKASIAKPRDARIDSGARQLALQVC